MKIAFHVHSDWSYDGKLTLAEVSSRFQRRGYDAVMLCEHCRTFDATRWREYQAACRDNSKGALLVAGIEYSDPANVVHLPTWGLTEFAGAEVASQRVLDAVQEENAICVFAHPSRRDAWRHFLPQWVDALSGYELWNRKTDGLAPSGDISQFAGTRLRPFAALDYHCERQRMPFALHLNAGASLTAESILASLRLGDYQHRVSGIPLSTCSATLPLTCLRGVNALKRILRRPQLRKLP